MAQIRRCLFCAGEIHGPAKPVYSRLITEGEQTAPIEKRYAHIGCARMLDDDEDDAGQQDTSRDVSGEWGPG